jgi:hypothetical protein
VASSGFFTDSYNLFATNVILPSPAFIYWYSDSLGKATDVESAINMVTLAGSLGFCLYGRGISRFNNCVFRKSRHCERYGLVWSSLVRHGSLLNLHRAEGPHASMQAVTQQKHS